jgi:hypothetical protein
MTPRTLAAALACLVAIFGAQSVAADPVEMMSLWESPASSDPIDPWPAGLRIVIYDDGQVLKVVRAPTASAQAQVITGRVSPEGVKERAARTIAVLANAPRPEYIKAEFPERRWTVLQVWDAAKQYQVKWAVVGHPCAGLEGNKTDPIDQQVRATLDPRFRAACDMLANTMVPEPVDWSPETIWIDLAEAEDVAGDAETWPPDWPEGIRYGRDLSVCINTQAPAQELTRKLVSLDKSVQQSTVGALIKSPDGKTWRVSGVRYGLPGPISHTDRGSDYTNTSAIAYGSCWRP